jgi:hypothetical protein
MVSEAPRAGRESEEARHAEAEPGRGRGVVHGVARRVRLFRVAGPERGDGELGPFYDRPARRE